MISRDQTKVGWNTSSKCAKQKWQVRNSSWFCLRLWPVPRDGQYVHGDSELTITDVKQEAIVVRGLRVGRAAREPPSSALPQHERLAALMVSVAP